MARLPLPFAPIARPVPSSNCGASVYGSNARSPCVIRVAFTTGPVIESTFWNTTSPTPPQLRTGESPLCADCEVIPVVPKVAKKSRSGAMNSSREVFANSRISVSCESMFSRGAPDTTTAFTFFEPITAPTPERAASRPCSLQMPARYDSCSPDGPIEATDAFLPYFSLNLFSTSIAPIPQYSEASSIDTSSPSIRMYTGLSAWP